MKFRLSGFLAGIACSGLLAVVILGSGAVPLERSTDAVEVTPGTSPARAGQGSGGSKASGDGFGILYAGATYRLSADGCETGSVRFVKATSAGTTPSYLPNQTDCVAPVYTEEFYQFSVYTWSAETAVAQSVDYRLYSGGGGNGLSVGGSYRDQFVFGRCGFELPQRDKSQAILGCGFTYVRQPIGQVDMPTLANTIQTLISEGVTMGPILVYQSPAA